MASVVTRSRAIASAPPGIRWDRVGRLALIAVSAVLLYLYISAGISLWGTWHASQADRARVAVLERQNIKLKAEHSQLDSRWLREAEASRLGMARSGEKVFVLQGLPRN